MLLTRRSLLVAPLLVGGAGVCAAGVEPMLLTIARYRLTPPRWPVGLRVSIAVVADVHACEPWMSVSRIEGIVATVNNLKPDLTVLLGDYVAGHDKVTSFVPDRDWARALAALRAPLGVYAILGNHDWWADHAALVRGRGPIAARTALERAGVQVLENETVRCGQGDHAFWVAGLGDQEAFKRYRHGAAGRAGADDLGKTLEPISDDAPIILLAHEPDIFPQVPTRVTLTLSGHTHGGQVRIFGVAPVLPSPLSGRYLYGHFLEEGRNLIVSGGLGCSWWPVRIGSPPEIVHIEIGA